MTTDEMVNALEQHVHDLEEEKERCKAALLALKGRRKPGRPALQVAAS